MKKQAFLLLIVGMLLINSQLMAQRSSRWLFSADASYTSQKNTDPDGSAYSIHGVAHLAEGRGAFSAQYMLPQGLGALGFVAGGEVKLARFVRLYDWPRKEKQDLYEFFVGPQYHYFFGAPSLVEARYFAGFRYGMMLNPDWFDKDPKYWRRDRLYVGSLEAGRLFMKGKRSSAAGMLFYESQPRLRHILVGGTPENPVYRELKTVYKDWAIGIRFRFWFTGK